MKVSALGNQVLTGSDGNARKHTFTHIHTNTHVPTLEVVFEPVTKQAEIDSTKLYQP